jgi:hypothetical protein
MTNISRATRLSVVEIRAGYAALARPTIINRSDST